MLELTDQIVAYVAAATLLLLPILATTHILLEKEDVRAAIGWMGLVWLVPVLGAILYLIFGVNRIHRRALRERSQRAARDVPLPRAGPIVPISGLLERCSPAIQAHARLMERITGESLLGGNDIRILIDGDEAYPAMLEAIDRAERSIALVSYIFEFDDAGRPFVTALQRAAARGVSVRVMVDAVGQMYDIPPIVGILRRHGINAAAFNRPSLRGIALVNLRTHRKILVVDGTIAFTGGMNIRSGHAVAGEGPLRIRDLHFRLCGPIVGQLLDVFIEDWCHTTREWLQGKAWQPSQGMGASGAVIARGIADGPDDPLRKTEAAMLSALAMANDSVRIATPYFLPDTTLLSGLSQAALRGVDVRVLVPGKNNLPYMKWASQANYSHLLARGCRIYESPPPFDHGKAMVVDRVWALIGSTNWDVRSFRLNFEFNVECYDTGFAERLADLIDERIAIGRAVDAEGLANRWLVGRLRDRLFWLGTPYL